VAFPQTKVIDYVAQVKKSPPWDTPSPKAPSKEKKPQHPHQRALRQDQTTEIYSLAFPAFFALAHLAFISAAIFFLAAGDISRFAASLAAGALPFAAILFATPARIFANPSALSLRFLGFNAGSVDGAVPLIFAHLAN
jgi:hypothetical protein